MLGAGRRIGLKQNCLEQKCELVALKTENICKTDWQLWHNRRCVHTCHTSHIQISWGPPRGEKSITHLVSPVLILKSTIIEKGARLTAWFATLLATQFLGRLASRLVTRLASRLALSSIEILVVLGQETNERQYFLSNKGVELQSSRPGLEGRPVELLICCALLLACKLDLFIESIGTVKDVRLNIELPSNQRSVVRSQSKCRSWTVGNCSLNGRIHCPTVPPCYFQLLEQPTGSELKPYLHYHNVVEMAECAQGLCIPYLQTAWSTADIRS